MIWTDFYIPFLETEYGIIAVTFDVMVIDYGFIKLHGKYSLKCIWITSAESGSLSNTTERCVIPFIMQAECNSAHVRSFDKEMQ